MSTTGKIVNWAARLVAAVILLQTLFFKFTGAEESKFIFEKVHAEPWGRIGSGVVELVTSILLLVPRTTGWGALLGLVVMTGAIATHLTVLGIEVQGDGGLLFIYALLVFISCLYLFATFRKQVRIPGKNA